MRAAFTAGSTQWQHCPLLRACSDRCSRQGSTCWNFWLRKSPFRCPDSEALGPSFFAVNLMMKSCDSTFHGPASRDLGLYFVLKYSQTRYVLNHCTIPQFLVLCWYVWVSKFCLSLDFPSVDRACCCAEASECLTCASPLFRYLTTPRPRLLLADSQVGLLSLIAYNVLSITFDVLQPQKQSSSVIELCKTLQLSLTGTVTISQNFPQINSFLHVKVGKEEHHSRVYLILTFTDVCDNIQHQLCLAHHF